jgi:hypothetical protein
MTRSCLGLAGADAGQAAAPEPYDNPTGRAAAAEPKYTPHIRGVREERKACDRCKGHKPRRWVVERTFAWLGRCQRRIRDYEWQTGCSEAMIKISMIHRMARSIEPAKAIRFHYRKPRMRKTKCAVNASMGMARRSFGRHASSEPGGQSLHKQEHDTVQIFCMKQFLIFVHSQAIVQTAYPTLV